MVCKKKLKDATEIDTLTKWLENKNAKRNIKTEKMHLVELATIYYIWKKKKNGSYIINLEAKTYSCGKLQTLKLLCT